MALARGKEWLDAYSAKKVLGQVLMFQPGMEPLYILVIEF
tara:strand:- start:563 stop:682 length:120 start_codon:yes stop_codon:yes gene_type:complete